MKDWPWYGHIILAVVVVALIFFVYFKPKSSELNGLKAEREKVEQEVMNLKRKNTQLKKIDLINKLKSHQGVPVTVLDELSKHIPYWVWLTEASYNKQIIKIKGRAISNNLIADYIYNLEQSPYFNNVNLISSTQRTLRNNQFLDFALTARYVLPPIPQPSQEKNIKEAKK